MEYSSTDYESDSTDTESIESDIIHFEDETDEALTASLWITSSECNMHFA